MSSAPIKFIQDGMYHVPKKLITKKNSVAIKQELTIEKKQMYTTTQTFVTLWKEQGKYLILPKAYGIGKYGNPDLVNDMPIARLIQDRSSRQRININFTSTPELALKPYQLAIINKVIAQFNNDLIYNGGLIIAGCGKGKTVMIIYLICVFKCKVLLVSHKKYLNNQFINRLETFSDFTGKVGRIQQGKFELDCDITVATIQSILSKCTVGHLERFDFIICDEVHHYASEEFGKLFKMVVPHRFIGITANTERKDNLFDIIKHNLGPIIHQEPDNLTDVDVYVKRLLYRTQDSEAMATLYTMINRKPEVNRSGMVTALATIEKRTSFICDLLIQLKNSGRFILCLSNRLKHVDIIYDTITSTIGADYIGKYIGGMAQPDLDLSATKPIIVGTFDMAEEGLDIPQLDTLVMATPKSTIKQPVGRILRRTTYALPPLILDIVDVCNENYVTQSFIRYEYLASRAYHISNYTIDESNTDPDANANVMQSIIHEYNKTSVRMIDPSVCQDEVCFGDD
ncbi:Helicase [uncultured virus]|nr:Helicase [uncultured virus]